jgi:hypothetical protein
VPVKYSLKTQFLLLLAGLVCAAGTAFLVNWIFSGPGLGLHYDFLLDRQKQPPAAREILIINTEEFIESSDIFSVLITLIEMEAANLIMAGRVSPSSSPVTLTEAEIRRRFVDEYYIIGSNIRNLFHAIRSGFVSPVQAPGYVDRLVELSDQGRDRLLSALINREEELLRAIAVFGNYIEVDLDPIFDKDGRLRRVQPIDPQSSVEHPVFGDLRSRFLVSQIETVENQKFLYLQKADEEEFDILLDRDGNIISPWNSDFRMIDISLFREYKESERAVRDALVNADRLGVFSKTLPEDAPLFLGDYALTLRDEMLKFPNEENRSEWAAARSNYFINLEEFLNKEHDLIDEELIQSLEVMREEYEKLSAIHLMLQKELLFSYCIMGCQKHALSSAILANAMLTGHHVKPAKNKYVLIWSICAAFAVLLIVFMTRPFMVLLCGICLSIFSSIVMSIIFIYSFLWIEPLVVLISSLAGIFVIFCCKCVIKNYRGRSFRRAYGMAVSTDVLKHLICLGKPGISEVVEKTAAVIAIKDINLLKREDQEKLHDAGKAKKIFFSLIKEAAYSCGAVITGFEADTVLVCFGSPLEKTSFDPVNKACSMVRKLLENEKITWRFGIDTGVCAFYWSPETGYSVSGRSSVRARVLVSKTVRLNARALITDAVREKINADVKKIASLYDSSEAIYELPVN